MARYELVNGYYTEILLIKTKEGLIPFPSTNAQIVKNEGTKLSKIHLKESIGKRRYEQL